MRKIKGISLLEIMLSLGIIAIILVMATRYYSVARLDQQTNAAADQINTVRAAAQRWLTSHGDYTGINSIADLQNLNLLPANFVNPWNNPIDVTAANGGTITITIENIPATACNNLLNRFSAQMVPPVPTSCGTGTQNTNFVGSFH